jgi:branched-chain amino acid transport system substrate-binding protein
MRGAFGGFNEDVRPVRLGDDQQRRRPRTRGPLLPRIHRCDRRGLPIDVVSVGCGNDTADRAIQEIRKIVEQDGANVVLGPLSGDEGIAIANYAKDHPEVTFINGISGAQEATLQVRAPNFFRFTGDGAQWNAGLGDMLHNTAGWNTAVVIADDYGFGWTSAAGFIADFCAAGGKVVQRVFPPLNTTDYSSFIAQLPNPDEVDGYFWAVGGTGTQASLEAFVNAKGDLSGKQHAGNLFFNPALASAIGPGIAGAYIGGFASFAGDVKTPEITAYAASADAAWDTLAGALTSNEPGPPSTALTFVFAYGYYLAGTALVQALNEVKGDLSDNHKALNAALSGMTLKGPFGTVTLDKNRQAIVDTTVQQLVLEGDKVVPRPLPSSRGSIRPSVEPSARQLRRQVVTRPLARFAACRGPARRFQSSMACRRNSRRKLRTVNTTAPTLRNAGRYRMIEAGAIRRSLPGCPSISMSPEAMVCARPERCRQDHLVQRGRRRHQATSGSVSISGVDCTLMPSRRRPVSESPARISALGCSPASRWKTICTWPSLATRVGIDRCGAHSPTSGRARRRAPQPRRSGSAITSVRGSVTSPMANNANSRWVWRW